MRVYPKLEPGNITAGQDGKPLVLSDYYPIGGTGRDRTPGIIDRLNSGRELYIQKGGRLGRKPGSRKTAEQRKEEYREAIALLKKGYSIRNVAKLTGKAVSTIQQVKKDFINS